MLYTLYIYIYTICKLYVYICVFYNIYTLMTLMSAYGLRSGCIGLADAFSYGSIGVVSGVEIYGYALNQDLTYVRSTACSSSTSRREKGTSSCSIGGRFLYHCSAEVCFGGMLISSEQKSFPIILRVHFKRQLVLPSTNHTEYGKVTQALRSCPHRVE